MGISYPAIALQPFDPWKCWVSGFCKTYQNLKQEADPQLFDRFEKDSGIESWSREGRVYNQAI